MMDKPKAKWKVSILAGAFLLAAATASLALAGPPAQKDAELVTRLRAALQSAQANTPTDV